MHSVRTTRRSTRWFLSFVLLMSTLAAVGAAAVLTTGPAGADTGFVGYSCSVGAVVPLDVTGSVPASIAPGSSFSLSNYQINVDLPEADVAELEGLGYSTLSGSITATVDAVGATPSTLTENVGSFSVNLPNPPADTPYSVPAAPITLGPFTADSGRVAIDAGSATLDFSNVGVSTTCDPPSPAPVVAHTTAGGPLAFIGNAADGTVTVFDQATGATVGSPITVGGSPDYIAVTPDGSQALVSTWPSGSSLAAIDTSTLKVSAHIPIDAPRGLAITPDGSTAWVAGGAGDDTFYPVNLASDTVGPSVALGTSGSAASLAIAPDGAMAYVVGQFVGVVPVDLATETVEPTIPIPASLPGEIQIAPDGDTAYVNAGDDLFPIDLTQNPPVVGSPITPCNYQDDEPFNLSHFAISPDGSTLWTGCSHEGSVVPVDLSTLTSGTPISIGTGSDVLDGVGITPDGGTIYVTDQTANSEIPVHPDGEVDTAIPAGHGATAIGIPPDQGPVAALSVTTDPSDPNGLTEDFDASPSQAPSSPIVSYSWHFGDGSTDQTSAPTDAHTYSNPGTYTATVTETDEAGTSTTVVSTGQEILRAGSGVASATATFTLSSCTLGCTPTVSNGNASVTVTQQGSTTGTLTLSVSPATLVCSTSYRQPAQVSTLTESSGYSSTTAIDVADVVSGLSSPRGVKVCYQSGGSSPPPPAFLKKCSKKIHAPCTASIVSSGADSITASLEVPPGDPRFWVDTGSLVLTAFSPTKAKLGASVTIKGTGMNQVTNVLFSATAPGTFVKAGALTLGPTSVTVTVPPGAVTGPVEVVTGSGYYISKKPFKVLG
jgi:YVTN family beta-propeller protein